MSKQQKEKKKKERHPVRNFLIVLILLGMLFGGGFGLWRYGGFEWGYQDDKKTESKNDNTETSAPVESSTEETAAATEATTEAADDTLIITVAGEEVKIASDSFTDEGKLKDKVMAVYKEGIKIELVDDKAVKSAYDMAKKVLDDLKYDYSEKIN